MSATPYHHGHLRSALIDAAVEVAREHGPDALAVRDLARRVGVSHNAAYRHFSGRDDLVTVVSDLTTRWLADSMRRRYATIIETDPVLRARLRLAASGLGYVDFARAEPGLFKMAFAVHDRVPVGPDAESDPYGLLNAALDELVEVGFLHPDVRGGADVVCWSMVHGVAVLLTDGPLKALSPQDADVALLGAIATIDRSYGATTGSPVGPHDLSRLGA